MKEAQMEIHKEEKRSRANIPSPLPKLSASEVFTKLFKCAPNAVVFSVLPGFDHPSLPKSQEVEPNLPVPLHNLYDRENTTLPNTDLRQLCAKAFHEIKITKDEADFLQKATIPQSQCLTWHEHRKGRITASYFYDVSRHIRGSQCYPTSIVKRIMQYYGSSENVPALKWGREKEDEARRDYISHMSAKHVDFVVRPCGLVVDPKYPYLGASPDGFVSCGCCGCGLLEIKCPIKFRDYSPTAEELLSDPSYCLKRNTVGEIHLPVSHKYYYQVQGQITV